MWYEASVTAQHGTEMVMGYGASPAPDGIDIDWACYAPAHRRILGPIGPVRVTATGMIRSDLNDESWREIRSAAGLVLRALLLGIGRETTTTDASRIRAELTRLGRSQRGAAAELGIDPRTMRRYCAGDLPVPQVVWLALSALTPRPEGSAIRPTIPTVAGAHDAAATSAPRSRR